MQAPALLRLPPPQASTLVSYPFMAATSEVLGWAINANSVTVSCQCNSATELLLTVDAISATLASNAAANALAITLDGAVASGLFATKVAAYAAEIAAFWPEFPVYAVVGAGANAYTCVNKGSPPVLVSPTQCTIPPPATC